MCGRFTLTASPDEIAEILALAEIEDFPPRYNIAPTQPILVVVGGSEARPDANRPGREARLVRWGLIPTWVKDLKAFPLLFNARSETAATKNSFRAAMTYRRCLVPASGFYEWRRDAKGKPGQAFFIRPRSGRPIAFAGLMETWHSADGSEIDTAAILTTAANGTLSSIHERMPVTVPEGAYERWLDCREFPPAGIADLLAPAGNDVYEAVPVSDRVGKVSNTDPGIQERVALASPSSGPDKDAAGSLSAEPDQTSLF